MLVSPLVNHSVHVGMVLVVADVHVYNSGGRVMLEWLPMVAGTLFALLSTRRHVFHVEYADMAAVLPSLHSAYCPCWATVHAVSVVTFARATVHQVCQCGGAARVNIVCRLPSPFIMCGACGSKVDI